MKKKEFLFFYGLIAILLAVVFYFGMVHTFENDYRFFMNDIMEKMRIICGDLGYGEWIIGDYKVFCISDSWLLQYDNQTIAYGRYYISLFDHELPTIHDLDRLLDFIKELDK